MDRLTQAGASGGADGLYGPDNYGYNLTTGNLDRKAGVQLSRLAGLAAPLSARLMARNTKKWLAVPWHSPLWIGHPRLLLTE